MKALAATWVDSPLGELCVCAGADGVCLIDFADRRKRKAQLEALPARLGCDVAQGDNPQLALLRDELAKYFAGRLKKFTVPVALRGTPFQVAVWKQLLKIPYGRTASYEQVAARVKRPGAQRAVGTANGRNKIAIVVPCHRVINKSGGLGGYGGELWRKEFLLELEQQHV